MLFNLLSLNAAFYFVFHSSGTFLTVNVKVQMSAADELLIASAQVLANI